MKPRDYERLRAGLSEEAQRAVDAVAVLEAYLCALQEMSRIDRREEEALRRRAKFRVVK